MTDASPAEIMRRLDEVVKKLSELAIQMRADHDANAKLYLPREFYNEARKNDQADVIDVAKSIEDVKTEQRRGNDFRRQVLLGFALTAAGGLVTLSVALSNLLAR